jgi:DNA-binding transcriptional regulator YhcF (GntR family)
MITSQEATTEAITKDTMLCEFEKINAIINRAFKLLESGEIVELSALEQKISHVCSSVVALPNQEQEELLPIMEEVLIQMDKLGSELTEKYSWLSESKPQI